MYTKSFKSLELFRETPTSLKKCVNPNPRQTGYTGTQSLFSLLAQNVRANTRLFMICEGKLQGAPYANTRSHKAVSIRRGSNTSIQLHI